MQSSSSCCVRFAAVVTNDPATLATGRALPPTQTGLSPAGSRQLRLAHTNSVSLYFTTHFADHLRQTSDIADHQLADLLFNQSSTGKIAQFSCHGFPVGVNAARDLSVSRNGR